MSEPLDLDGIEARAEWAQGAIDTASTAYRSVSRDVPALVAEVRRLRNENERLRGELNDLHAVASERDLGISRDPAVDAAFRQDIAEIRAAERAVDLSVRTWGGP